MKNENAFTLAETMIVVVVLGIIATLTIPALVNKNKESVAKTKVRKAMAAYESALNKMIIENDLKSDDTLAAWAGANCANSTNYFKKVQGYGCIFKTSDGIWWNISDIERPVISFKEINAGNEEQITANANNANDKTAFVLVGRFGNDGSLRVDDLAYETGHDYESSLAQVQKLYNFLSGKKSPGGSDEECDAVCQMAKYENTLCTGEPYIACKENLRTWSNQVRYYDNNGNLIIQKNNCDSSWDNCQDLQKATYDDNGNKVLENYGCDLDGNSCSMFSKWTYDDNGNKTSFFEGCDINTNQCATTGIREYNDNGKIIIEYGPCSVIDNTCSGSRKYTYNENGYVTANYSCDENGIRCNDCYSGTGQCINKNSHGYYDPEDTVYDD